MANKQTFNHYLSAAQTRIFRRDGPIAVNENPTIDSLFR